MPIPSKKIIFVSYNIGFHGDVTAEWASDKLRALEHSGDEVLIVCSPAGSIDSETGFQTKIVWPIGYQDFSEQIKSLRAKGKKIPVAKTILPLVLANTVGRIWDWLFFKLASSVGSGRYSWSLPAALTVAWHAAKMRGSVIFSTGGPTGAHLAASIASIATRRPHYLEAQDPLYAAEMPLNATSEKVLIWLEGFLIRHSRKSVFVTRLAAYRASLRHPNAADKVEAIYPGSWKVGGQIRKKAKRHNFRILHVGTLYGTRNLDNLFLALDRLYLNFPDKKGKVQIVQKGLVACENRSEYLERDDFVLLPLGSRAEALSEALASEALLLVQNTDTRSQETIPYKFYDYLNLGVPIFALLNNEELRHLVENAGGFAAQNTEVDQIGFALENLLNQATPRLGEGLTEPISFDIKEQLARLFH